LAVRLEQLLPLGQAQVQLDQLVERAYVFRLDAQHAPVDVDRRFRLIQDLFVERTGAEQVIALLVRRGQERGLGQVRLGQLVVALGDLIEPLECARRLEVARVRGQHLLVVRDRTQRVAQVLLADLRGARVQQRPHAGIFAALDLGLVDLGQLLPGGGGGRDAIQLLARAAVGRVFGQRARKRAERVAEVFERDLVQLGHAVQELDPLIARGAVLHLDVVDRDQLRVLVLVAVERLEDLGDLALVLGAREQALERGERLRVVRIALQDLAVDVDRGFGRAHARLAQRAQPQHQHQLLIGVVGQG
jgi:hypothetical protein